MIWVSIQARKPAKSGYYHVKGRGRYQTVMFFDDNSGFVLNKTHEAELLEDKYFYWLDESSAIYEELKSSISINLGRIQGLTLLVSQYLDYMGLDRGLFLSKYRGREYVKARQVISYVCFKVYDFKVKEIGAVLMRDHSTISFAAQTNEGCMYLDDVRIMTEQFVSFCGARLPNEYLRK